MNTEQFWNWAEQELESHHLNWYKVERQTGLSNATISKRARQLLPPTFTTCQAIAKAFHLKTEVVLRKAGLIPSIPEDTKREQDEELLIYFHGLPPRTRTQVLITTRALHEEQATYQTDKGDQ